MHRALYPQHNIPSFISSITVTFPHVTLCNDLSMYTCTWVMCCCIFLIYAHTFISLYLFIECLCGIKTVIIFFPVLLQQHLEFYTKVEVECHMCTLYVKNWLVLWILYVAGA